MINAVLYSNLSSPNVLQVMSGCRIVADGTIEADATITIDFGQGACTSGSQAELLAGSIILNGVEVVLYGTSYKGKAMCDCLTVTCRPIHFSPDTSHVKTLFLP